MAPHLNGEGSSVQTDSRRELGMKNREPTVHYDRVLLIHWEPDVHRFFDLDLILVLLRTHFKKAAAKIERIREVRSEHIHIFKYHLTSIYSEI